MEWCLHKTPVPQHCPPPHPAPRLQHLLVGGTLQIWHRGREWEGGPPGACHLYDFLVLVMMEGDLGYDPRPSSHLLFPGLSFFYCRWAAWTGMISQMPSSLTSYVWVIPQRLQFCRTLRTGFGLNPRFFFISKTTCTCWNTNSIWSWFTSTWFHSLLEITAPHRRHLGELLSPTPWFLSPEA